jgi:phosphohistidine phosphatase
MATRLKDEGITPKLLFASPAKRAWETAQAYRDALKLPLHSEARIYEATLTTLLYLIEEAFETCDSVMIVGHNPALSEAVSYFDRTFRDALPSAGVAILELEGDAKARTGKCVATLYPRG